MRKKPSNAKSQGGTKSGAVRKAGTGRRAKSGRCEKPSNARNQGSTNPGARRRSSAVRNQGCVNIGAARKAGTVQRIKESTETRRANRPGVPAAGCLKPQIVAVGSNAPGYDVMEMPKIWREIRRSAERQRTKPQRGALSQDDAKSRPMRKVIQCEKLGQHEPRRKAKIKRSAKSRVREHRRGAKSAQCEIRRSAQSRNRAVR